MHIPTYGVLAHGIHTITMDMDKFEDDRTQILHDHASDADRAHRTVVIRSEAKSIGISTMAQTIYPCAQYYIRRCNNWRIYG